MTSDMIAMFVLLAFCGLGTLAMFVVAIRYLLLDDTRKAALRSDPTRFFDLPKGEEILRGVSVLGMAIGLFSLPWWPSRAPNPVVEAWDTPRLISWGAIAWLAVAALLVRRLIYKRWI